MSIVLTTLEIKCVPDDDISLMHEMQVCTFSLDINHSIFNIQVRRSEPL